MAGVNKVILVGNLGKDPETKRQILKEIAFIDPNNLSKSIPNSLKQKILENK